MMLFSTGAMAYILGTGSLKAAFTNMTIEAYSGAQPTSADAPPTGTLLAKGTLNGGAFTPGSATNGLNFDAPSGATIQKAPSENWVLKGVADGTIGWIRFKSNAFDAGGQSTTAIRADCSYGVTSGDMRGGSASITTGGSITVDNWFVDATNNV